MKKIIFCILLCISGYAHAQQKLTELDKSPMDMSYCPQNYPILKMNGKITTQPVARVVYSRPQKAGREIFGNLVKYNEIWRFGANEVTEIEFFKPVKINNKIIPKGRYSMYAICTENKWTLIINSEKDIWGLSYNPQKDILRVDVPVQTTSDITEAFTIYFEDAKTGCNLIALWDNVKISLPVNF